ATIILAVGNGQRTQLSFPVPIGAYRLHDHRFVGEECGDDAFEVRHLAAERPAAVQNPSYNIRSHAQVGDIQKVGGRPFAPVSRLEAILAHAYVDGLGFPGRYPFHYIVDMGLEAGTAREVISRTDGNHAEPG